MAFMQPTAEYMAVYHVETEYGTELIHEMVCGDILHVPDAGRPALKDYCQGDVYSRFFAVERKVGWYGRLSAPGYLDCTEWDGPHPTERAALEAVKEAYGVKDNGDDEDWSESEPQ